MTNELAIVDGFDADAQDPTASPIRGKLLYMHSKCPPFTRTVSCHTRRLPSEPTRWLKSFQARGWGRKDFEQNFPSRRSFANTEPS